MAHVLNYPEFSEVYFATLEYYGLGFKFYIQLHFAIAYIFTYFGERLLILYAFLDFYSDV